MKNEEFELYIDDLTADGAGVGRRDGFAVFVPGALPGEVVRCRAVKVLKSYAFGKAADVITPSPYRVEPFCGVGGRCGGCPLICVSYEGQLLFKEKRVKDALQRIGGFSGVNILPVESGEPLGYRNKASFPIRDSGGKPVAGFFAKGSHRVVSAPTCAVNEFDPRPVIDTITGYMEECGVSAYNEELFCGVIRHLIIRSGEEGLLICIVINAAAAPREDEIAGRLLALRDAAGVCANVNKGRNNVILGGLTRVIGGVGAVTINISGIGFSVGAASFFQVNTRMAERLIEAALTLCEPDRGDIVFDIYCGVGAVGLVFARRVKFVYGVEIVKGAVINARENAARNGIQNAEFIEGDCRDGIVSLIDRGIKPSIIILDPPRSGCSKETISAVISAGARKIAYISCDPATLARDLRLLCFDMARYSIKAVKPVDMFPQTSHIETVVILEKDADGGLIYGRD